MTPKKFKSLNTEKLNTLGSKTLLKLLAKPYSTSFNLYMALEDCDLTWKEVGEIRVQIVKTIWANFPRVAERERLIKFN